MNYMASFNVAELDVLRGEWAEIRDMCWSKNTHKTRQSQWRRFFAFCAEFGFNPIPAAAETMCLYIVFLARSCCYITIKNYVSGVWALHDYWGVRHLDTTSFIIKSTLQGAKRLLGCETVQAPPLSPEDMVKLYKVLDMSIFTDLQLWCAVTVAYRCLLRVSHITESPHTIKVKDIVFTDSGFDIHINSSKTVQFKERAQVIPVVRSSGILCPAYYLQCYIAMAILRQEDSLFPYSYNRFASLFKGLCRTAGLKEHYTTHSMRRGSATFLSSFLPLHDVKTYGDWKSWAVLLYISDNYASRKGKDYLVASKLAEY